MRSSVVALWDLQGLPYEILKDCLKPGAVFLNAGCNEQVFSPKP